MAAVARMALAGLVLLTVVAVPGGCGGPDAGKSPEAAVRAFLAAARASDAQKVYARLGPRTRARLDERAQAAARLVGLEALRPWDLVSVGWAPPAWEAATIRTIAREGDVADVEVGSQAGDRQIVSLVRENGQWLIELSQVAR